MDRRPVGNQLRYRSVRDLPHSEPVEQRVSICCHRILSHRDGDMAIHHIPIKEFIEIPVLGQVCFK